MSDPVEQLIEELRSFAEAYPEDIFRPLTDADRKEHPVLITRASADMGRHMGKWMLRAAAALLACAETARRLEVAERALLHHGYRKSCDIPACNCGDQWLHGGNAAQRLSEIDGVLRDEGLTQGKTILNAVKELLATRAQGEKE